jgi:hypothetical protein
VLELEHKGPVTALEEQAWRSWYQSAFFVVILLTRTVSDENQGHKKSKWIFRCAAGMEVSLEMAVSKWWDHSIPD